MKLSIEDLKVDSYASQINESELTEVKGGTSPGCAIAARVLITLAAKAIHHKTTKIDGGDR